MEGVDGVFYRDYGHDLFNEDLIRPTNGPRLGCRCWYIQDPILLYRIAHELAQHGPLEPVDDMVGRAVGFRMKDVAVLLRKADGPLFFTLYRGREPFVDPELVATLNQMMDESVRRRFCVAPQGCPWVRDVYEAHSLYAAARTLWGPSDGR